MGRVISLVNFKGGVGKTTLSVNLAAGIANRQNENRPYSVLVVDADPQGHASAYMLGEKKYDPGQSLARATALWMDSKLEFLTEDFIVGNKFPNPVFDGSFPNLHLLPPGPDLREVEISGHVRLARMEANIAGRKYYKVIWYLCEKFFTESYDFIIIDCPPHYDWITAGLVLLSSDLIVPVIPDFLSTNGLKDLVLTITEEGQMLHRSPQIRALALMLWDEKNSVYSRFISDLRSNAVKECSSLSAVSGRMMSSCEVWDGLHRRVDVQKRMQEFRPLVDSSGDSDSRIELEAMVDAILAWK